MGHRRVDGQLGQVSQDTEIVVFRRVLRQLALHLHHLIRSLKQAGEILPNPSHGLGIRRVDTQDAHVVQHILGGHGLRADSALGKGDILGNVGAEVMTHHEHVHVLGQGVHRVGAGGVGGRRQNVKLTGHADDVRRMAAPRALGMVGVDCASGDGGDGVLDKPSLVQRVGVDRHRHIVIVGHTQATVDGRRSGAPIFVQLQTACTRRYLLDQRARITGVALAQQPPVDRQPFRSLQHTVNVPDPRGAGRGPGAIGWTGAASQHGGNPVGQGVLDLLRRNHVYVGVDAARCGDQVFACDYLGARSHY